VGPAPTCLIWAFYHVPVIALLSVICLEVPSKRFEITRSTIQVPFYNWWIARPVTYSCGIQVLSVPLVIAYPVISTLDGWMLMVILNLASLVKNILSVSLPNPLQAHFEWWMLLYCCCQLFAKLLVSRHKWTQDRHCMLNTIWCKWLLFFVESLLTPNHIVYCRMWFTVQYFY
jgi:hypothetical protein